MCDDDGNDGDDDGNDGDDNNGEQNGDDQDLQDGEIEDWTDVDGDYNCLLFNDPLKNKTEFLAKNGILSKNQE